MAKLAKNLVDTYPEPPRTVYTGVGTLEDASQNIQTYFLTTDDVSQAEWENILTSSSKKAFKNEVPLQPDGIHVTIGFRGQDIWRQNKRVPPFLPFTTPSSTFPPHVFLPRFRGVLESAPAIESSSSREGSPISDPLPQGKDVGQKFRQYLQSSLKGQHIDVSEIPGAQLAILDYLVYHRNVRPRLKECPDGYYLVGFIVHSGRRYLSDDDAYKKNPRLQVLVPRGLHHAFKLDENGKLSWLGAVYPTSKFFGDNDTDEGVELLGEEELKAETGGSDVKFILD